MTFQGISLSFVFIYDVFHHQSSKTCVGLKKNRVPLQEMMKNHHIQTFFRQTAEYFNICVVSIQTKRPFEADFTLFRDMNSSYLTQLLHLWLISCPDLSTRRRSAPLKCYSVLKYINASSFDETLCTTAATRPYYFGRASSLTSHAAAL